MIAIQQRESHRLNFKYILVIYVCGPCTSVHFFFFRNSFLFSIDTPWSSLILCGLLAASAEFGLPQCPLLCPHTHRRRRINFKIIKSIVFSTGAIFYSVSRIYLFLLFVRSFSTHWLCMGLTKYHHSSITCKTKKLKFYFLKSTINNYQLLFRL